MAPHGYAVDRASVRQRKTGRPVRFEITEKPARRSTTISRNGVKPLIRTSSLDAVRQSISSTRQYARLLSGMARNDRP